MALLVGCDKGEDAGVHLILAEVSSQKTVHHDLGSLGTTLRERRLGGGLDM